jgi:hypothetical protein
VVAGSKHYTKLDICKVEIFKVRYIQVDMHTNREIKYGKIIQLFV